MKIPICWPERYVLFSGFDPTDPIFDPSLDGRKEIAKYNRFMDEIFSRMNSAIKAKNLDPMDLKLLPNSDKIMPRQTTTFYDVSDVSRAVYFKTNLNFITTTVTKCAVN